MKPLLDPALEQYAADHSTQPGSLLQELEAYTREHMDNPQMVVGRLEAAFLQLLVKLVGARRILEVGLFTGYSALAMAEALDEHGEVISCEVEDKHAEVARSFFKRSPVGHKISIHLGPALDTLDSIQGPFDMAFIDADKENYSAYYDRIVPMLRSGGLLVADNVLWSGRVLEPEKETDHALVAFNDKIQNDSAVENVLLTVRDGVLLARKV